MERKVTYAKAVALLGALGVLVGCGSAAPPVG